MKKWFLALGAVAAAATAWQVLRKRGETRHESLQRMYETPPTAFAPPEGVPTGSPSAGMPPGADAPLTGTEAEAAAGREVDRLLRENRERISAIWHDLTESDFEGRSLDDLVGLIVERTGQEAGQVRDRIEEAIGRPELSGN